MQPIRKLRCQTTPLSSSHFSLIGNYYINDTKIAKCHLPLYSSDRSFCQHLLINLNMKMDVLKFQDRFLNHIEFFSSMAGTVLVQARDLAKLCMQLEFAIDERRYSDAWNLYKQHMQIEGFPRKSIVNKLLTGFTESLDSHWLEKAYNLVEMAIEESRQNLLQKETLVYLSFGLAKCGLPIASSTLIRKLVEMEQFPSVSAYSAILAHISQTAHGAYLATELIFEMAYLFQDNRVDPRKKSNAPLIAMKPNTVVFSIALAGCLLFGTTRKAEELLDMMPRINVKPDATLLIVMAHIYEKNGRREELKMLKRHVDEAHNLTDMQFRQFYNCLLTCHLKFGDLDSASHMVLEMLKKAKEARNSLAAATFMVDSVKNGNKSEKLEILLEEAKSSSSSSIMSYEDFSRDQSSVQLEAEAQEMLDKLLAKLQMHVELIITDHGILQPTERIFVKLVKAFLEAGNTKELAEFLLKAEKEDCPLSVDKSALVHVIDACISLNWLDQAYDLLDEMRLSGVKTGSSVYSSLLKAFCKENREGEVKSLLRDVRKAGIQLDSSCYDALIQSRVLKKDTYGALDLFKEMKESKLLRFGHYKFDELVKGCEGKGEAGLMAKLLEEIREGQRVDCGVHDWNNVIHFFCKKRLMQDAEKALKKMRSLGHTPNAQTYHSMTTGYAAIGGKYVEVAELWGEMKSIAHATSMKFDQELLDSVLYTFVRGGFFVRANEVVEMMEKRKIFIDKYKYRTLFLKYHKTLHKGKASKFQTEAQVQRREAVLAFKKWVGLF